MAEVVIFGAGDIGKIAHYYFSHDSKHDIAGFTVDRAYRQADTFLDLPLVDFEEVTSRFPPGRFKMFVAMSYAKTNKVRASKYYQAKERGYELMSYVSTKCSFLTDLPIGDNCFVLEDNTVQPFVKIGSNVTLWSGNHIGHDSIIEDHCFIASHVVISGRVHIHPYCFVGVNATLRNGLTIAAETVIGAGAVIMKDTEEKSVYLAKRAELFSKPSDKIDI